MKEEHTLEEQDGAKWDYGTIYVRRSIIPDARAVGSNLRIADRNELLALTELSPVSIIEDGIRDSVACYTICLRENNTPCAVFGVNGCGDRQVGVVWCLGTPDLFHVANKFLRNSKFWVKKLGEHYEFLFNVIDARQTVYIKWLKWLGFEFTQKFEEYGLERRPFWLFIKKNV